VISLVHRRAKRASLGRAGWCSDLLGTAEKDAQILITRRANESGHCRRESSQEYRSRFEQSGSRELIELPIEIHHRDKSLKRFAPMRSPHRRRKTGSKRTALRDSLQPAGIGRALRQVGPAERLQLVWHLLIFSRTGSKVAFSPAGILILEIFIRLHIGESFDYRGLLTRLRINYAKGTQRRRLNHPRAHIFQWFTEKRMSGIWSPFCSDFYE